MPRKYFIYWFHVHFVESTDSSFECRTISNVDVDWSIQQMSKMSRMTSSLTSSILRKELHKVRFQYNQIFELSDDSTLTLSTCNLKYLSMVCFR